jgi:predicted NBD/HSP70 family sugar kinase
LVILSTQHVRDLNTSRILQTLRVNGPLSRAQLASMSGVSRGTIGAITKRLLEVNVLEEQESTLAGKSGRPGTPLWFGRRAAMSGAIAIRRNRLEVAVINVRGDILAHEVSAVRPAADAAEIDRTAVGSFRRTAKGFVAEIVKIGISVPGVCDHATGEVIACPELPALVGTHLVDALRADTGIGVVVDDDSLGSALGEQWFGGGRGHATFVTVETGFGIGAGIVVDGTIIRGPAGFSAEVGHTCVDRFGVDCSCGLRGCWETIATTRWLRKAAARIGLKGANRIGIGRVIRLADGGDPDAVALVQEFADNISIGLANLAQALCVGRFILQGDAIEGGEQFRRRIEMCTQSRVFEPLRSSLSVELSQMADKAGILGAAAIALDSALPVSA